LIDILIPDVVRCEEEACAVEPDALFYRRRTEHLPSLSIRRQAFFG
jgi:hypothetical protein